MKLLLNLVRRMTRKFFPAGIAATVLAGAGCGPSDYEENGHKEPLIAEYVVTVTPSLKTLILKPTDTMIVIPVQLAGRCKGPTECATFKPNWQSHTKSEFVTKVDIGNVQSPSTTVTVFFDAKKFLSSDVVSSLMADDHVVEILFRPESAPQNLTLRGPGYLDLIVNSETPVARRQEEPPTEPRLGVTKKNIFIGISGGAASAEEEASITYGGPDTQISEISVDGPGKDKLTVVVPSTGLMLHNGDRPLLTVRFQADALDRDTYKALLTIRTANQKQPTYVLLKGRREP